MIQRTRDQLRQAKTELVRLVIQGPVTSPSAAASAERLLVSLSENATDSRASRVTASLREQFQAWFSDATSMDAQLQKERRASMLLNVGELIDLLLRKLRI